MNLIQNSPSSKGLKDSVFKAIDKRFKHILTFSSAESRPYILSSVFHPKFKMNWVPKDDIPYVKDIFLTECNKLYNSNLSFEPSESVLDEDDDFFSVFNEIEDTVGNRQERVAELEALEYITNKNKSLNILDNTKVLKHAFLKYNTTLPSSASVERLFSKAIQILTPRRNRLKDEILEQILFLKCNYDLI